MPRAPLVRDDQLVQSIARRIRQVDQAGICAIEQHPLSRPLDQVVQELERAERDTQVRRENLARAPGRGDEIHAQVRLALAHVQARKRLAATKRRQEAMLQRRQRRSEEHTSELQSLMRISYAVFCLKKKKNTIKTQKHI